MPIYEYRCDNCGHELETIQKVSEDPLRVCPECDAAALVKKVSAAGFRLKGGGWYETDFKSGNKRNVSGDGSGTQPKDGAAAKDDVSSKDDASSKDAGPSKGGRSKDGAPSRDGAASSSAGAGSDTASKSKEKGGSEAPSGKASSGPGNGS